MSKLKQLWSNLRASFWFVPSLIVAAVRSSGTNRLPPRRYFELTLRNAVTVIQPILFVLLTGWLRLWDMAKRLLSLPRSAI